MYVVSRPVSLTRTRDERRRLLQGKTIGKLWFTKGKKSLCKILLILMKKSRLFRHEIILSIPGCLHWTWTHSVASLVQWEPSSESKWPISARETVCSHISNWHNPRSRLAAWLQSVTVGHPSCEHQKPREQLRHTELVTVITAQRNVWETGGELSQCWYYHHPTTERSTTTVSCHPPWS